MTLKVENDWSNPPIYTGIPNELRGKTYSLVNVPVQIWEQIRDFIAPLLAEPKEFGAVVEARIENPTFTGIWVHVGNGWWLSEPLVMSYPRYERKWSDLTNPKLVSK